MVAMHTIDFITAAAPCSIGKTIAMANVESANEFELAKAIELPGRQA
jgi:hypothetical protein